MLGRRPPRAIARKAPPALRPGHTPLCSTSEVVVPHEVHRHGTVRDTLARRRSRNGKGDRTGRSEAPKNRHAFRIDLAANPVSRNPDLARNLGQNYRKKGRGSGRRDGTMRSDRLHVRGEENPGTRYTSRTSSGSTPSDVQKEVERGRAPARPFRCRHRRARAVKVISCTTTGRRKAAACECAAQRHKGRCARINVPRRRAEMSQNGRVERGRRGPKDDFLRKQRQKCENKSW